MYRILLVEDMIKTIEQLEIVLAEAFPDAQIDKAETIESAQALIKSALDHQRYYHLVILDFMLPKDVGENPEPDETLCDLLCQKMTHTVIAHITAHYNDERVQKHLKKVHGEDLGAFAQDKVGSEWGADLVKKLKEHLHGKRIKTKLRNLFAPNYGNPDDGYEFINRSHVRGTGGKTHKISDLVRDIENHWRDLDQPTQEEIRKIFVIDEDENGTHAGLL